MTTKICTSIEQSKKLLEFGLNPETADMYWDKIGTYATGFRFLPIVRPNPYYGYSEENVVLAWSLSALLELTNDDIYNYFPTFTKEGEKYQMSYLRTDNHYYEITSFTGKSPIDAAFNMIIWLLEHNYLEK